MKAAIKRFPARGPATVLLVNFGGLGDLLLATPFFREIRRIYPAARIRLLAVAASTPILQGNPWLDEIIELPGLTLRHLPAALPRLLPLRRAGLLVSMLPLADRAGAWKFRLLHALLAPRFSVGLDTAGRGKFFSLPVYEADWGQWNAVDNYLKLLGRLGGRTDIRHPQLFLGAGIDSGLPPHPGRWLGLHPGASVAAKRWPVERFARVAAELAGRLADLRVAITGTAAERDLAQELIRQSGLPPTRITDLTGRTRLETLAALLRRLDLYLTNDTGTMHMAAALDRPLLALFGPGDRRRFSPVSRSGRIRVLTAAVDCSPCTLATCPDLRCQTGISVDAVVEAALSMLMDPCHG